MAERIPQESAEGQVLGMATIGDSSSVRTWSGTPFFMARALERHFPDLRRVGPFDTPLLNVFRVYGKALQVLAGKHDFRSLGGAMRARHPRGRSRRGLRAGWLTVGARDSG